MLPTSLVPEGMHADYDALSALDYIEIHQLYARYAASLDFGEGDVRFTMFAPGGTFKNIVDNHRAIPIEELAARTTNTGNNGDRHITMQLVITPTAEGAKGFAYAIKVDRHGKVGTGFYDDTLVKTAEGWKFMTRELWHDTEPASPYYFNSEKPAPH